MRKNSKRNTATAANAATQPTTQELLADVAAPAKALFDTPNAMTGVRRAIDETVAGGWTPSKLARCLADARTLTDTRAYFSMAEELEERSANFRSLISTRKQAVAALPFAGEPASDKLRDKKVLEFCLQVAESYTVRASLFSLADALSKGVAVAKVNYNYGATWTPESIEWVDPRWLVFDKTDGKSLAIAPDVAGGAPQALERWRFIVHKPELKSGLSVRSGLALPAAWLYVARGLAQRDWLGFLELYGQSVRVGKYKPGTRPEDIRVLKQAVANLGTDAAAVMPDNMVIEFIKDATVSGTADAYERLCRYADESEARLILGGSLTSGSDGGGSYALGQVHNEVRADLLKADAAALSATLMRDLFAPLVAINFGPDTPLPRIFLQVEEAEDVAALVDAIAKLVPLGFEVSQDELRARLRLRAPKQGEAILAAPAAAAPLMPAANTNTALSLTRGCPAHDAHAANQRDQLDGLADNLFGQWERATTATTSHLSEAAANASNLDELRASLVAAVNSADVSALAELLTKARAKANLAGNAGADL